MYDNSAESQRLGELVIQFALTRLHQEVVESDLYPDTDHQGFACGYTAALYDVVENLMLPQMGVSEDSEMYVQVRAAVLERLVLRVSAADQVRRERRYAALEKEMWKVPTN